MDRDHDGDDEEQIQGRGVLAERVESWVDQGRGHLALVEDRLV